jgi:acyl-CoA synthetase (AMP-forming)/AMP-acid ligase II
VLANPLHHTNSTAISDWGMRRKGAIIHLFQRYSTDYWKILVDIADSKRDLLIAPLVSRHIDFLEDLFTQSRMPVMEAKIKEALTQTEILIGSAPVGPTTIRRIIKFTNHLPNVRFGSTETCLQVMATPRTLSPEHLMKVYEAGWSHCYNGAKTPGYYIGREHFPFTRVKAVKSVEPGSKSYLQPCENGEPGYLITQGANIMSHYVGDPEATKEVLASGWYTGLKDIAFALKNDEDGGLDYYWMSRDSEFLIRGGANYAYAQIATDLSLVLTEDFQLKPDQFRIAVIGLRLESEHEDSCCVTIELNLEASDMESQLKSEFMEKAKKKVSKSILPRYLRFAKIPLNFKGAVLYPQLKQEFSDYLRRDENVK